MQVRPLHREFGAEVIGAGLMDVATNAAAYAFVRAAFEEHSVLLFRDQEITDVGQVAFSARFGPLELGKVASRGAGTFFGILTNNDGRGGVVPPDHKEALRARANQLWHTDSSFKTNPAMASVLSARVIPPTGGETEFTSMRRGWERLSESMKHRLANAYAWHAYWHSRGKIAAHLCSREEREAMPAVLWRMRWRNPANGLDSLYLASHTFGIEGMAEPDAQTLVDQLIDEMAQPEHTYLHVWRPGDVVIWDNRAVLHRGRPWPDDKIRHMVRTTIAASPHDGLAEMYPVKVAA